tara:strand:+ start:3247 stop:4695 length:1449 start_codon:yes stop_codon:yes gene_type:complete
LESRKSIYWHDYETFGSDPRLDRACQFAGVRTDEDLNIVDEALVIYCRPSIEVIPHPEACLITGISPQEAEAKGLSEREFAAQIIAEFSEPQTCVAGFNNLRFDDEVTRHLLYRCFYDPYEREWKNGNSRWDIIDLLRMTYALRPEGLNWPSKDDGSPSFKLEDFTQANDIKHEGAHDALSDVYATIATAKIIKEKQPRLYDFYYNHRNKNKVLSLFKLHDPQAMVHISSMYPASKGCMAIVLPLLQDPVNSNGIIVYDLSKDPSAWINASAESIKERLFTATDELPEGLERVALKTVHLNKCPALAPLSVLTDTVLDRFKLDLELCEQHKQQLLANTVLREKLSVVFTPNYKEEHDPDLMLYSGGFFDNHDKGLFAKIRNLDAESLAAQNFDFHDSRLPEMLFRYRCRNYPESLTEDERQRWYLYCKEQLFAANADGVSKADTAEKIIREKHSVVNEEQNLLLKELSQYIEQLRLELGVSP